MVPSSLHIHTIHNTNATSTGTNLTLTTNANLHHCDCHFTSTTAIFCPCPFFSSLIHLGLLRECGKHSTYFICLSQIIFHLAADEGARRAICDMTLLMFHLVLSSIIF